MDVPSFRALRLDALRRHPEAFVPLEQEERTLNLSFIKQRLRNEWVAGDNFIIGAFGSDGLAGGVGVMRSPRAKQRHIATIWILYTDPEARTRGIGRRLLLSAIERCRAHAGIEVVQLCVSSESVAARKLYESVGFRSYGIEPNAMKFGDRYIDVEHMTLDVSSH